MINSTMANWDNVTKTYRGQTALADFSLSLGPGANYLLGPNGAGKTTALSVLTGVRAATEGRAQVMGLTVKRGGPHTKLMGTAPQSLDFPPTLSVAEILRFVAIHYPNPHTIGTLSDQLGLEPILDKKCGSLSGGGATSQTRTSRRAST